MDFDSPDVMKDFPGLYATELNKKCKDDSDFSDDATKNESSIGKKKEKKDKKDKDKGYAALEGESSGDENSKSRSPSKYKKTKSFKFTSSKSKERRDKSREKEGNEKKREKEKKQEKKVEKERGKTDKYKKSKVTDENCSLADALPIFGVSLDLAVERSKCHDGIDIPLPVRKCIDYLESVGLSFEGIYKVSGTKSKVIQIRKMFNNREDVDLFDYDVPTTTSLLKMFLRDIPEPLFTNELLIRFEEAGAILSSNTREKHLRILIDNLPSMNKLILSWLLVHLDNVSLNEKINKMSRTNLGAALNHTFHVSSRLLTALIHHSKALFPGTVLSRYVPPLPAGAILPLSADLIQLELRKQESLLNQIHMEMNCGCIVKQREELLWEVQRIITQLKRQMKSCQKDKETVTHHESLEEKNMEEEKSEENIQRNEFNSYGQLSEEWQTPIKFPENIVSNILPEKIPPPPTKNYFEEKPKHINFDLDISPESDIGTLSENFSSIAKNVGEYENSFNQKETTNKSSSLDRSICLLKLKNHGLLQLREKLIKAIQAEHKEIESLKVQLMNKKLLSPVVQHNDNLDKIMDLLQKENQILQIKKINLVRHIIEQQEICIDLQAKIELHVASH
ncbi:hypothetical protein WA026_004582 [Henosepilachna vigintioctopunctata]|uniref:Rho-GAP domain-containing protein n=1 Tax=Henosepilachna vigintioctopunctata TaxID=420089 RepID=A0AAW1V0V6_9CUCU